MSHLNESASCVTLRSCASSSTTVALSTDSAIEDRTARASASALAASADDRRFLNSEVSSSRAFL
eukprot:scaffold109014_cov30-Tisochrysis_lutea.AAC.2